MVESGGLENRYRVYTLSGVRIPHPPPLSITKLRGERCFLTDLSVRYTITGTMRNWHKKDLRGFYGKSPGRCRKAVCATTKLLIVHVRRAQVSMHDSREEVNESHSDRV